MFKFFSALLVISILSYCSSPKKRESMLMNDNFVDLRGKPTSTILINSTSDTLKLEAAVYGMIPIAEQILNVTLIPGTRDTIVFSLSYPDFIHFSNSVVDLKIFSAPGRELICDIRNTRPQNIVVSFTGDLSQVNDYYLAHQNHFGAYYEHNRPYFEAGDIVRNFDDYPAIVDSITGVSLSFLKTYDKPLPEWFTSHERARLKFKSGFIKHNCLATKEFYEARTIPKSPSYFDFDNSLSLYDSNIVLCHEYLSYSLHKIQHIAKSTKSRDSLREEYHVIDSLYGKKEVSDLMRILFLSHMAFGSLPNFRDQLAQVNFGDSNNRSLIDSLVRARLGVPSVGTSCPNSFLADIEGNRLSLSSYKGKVLLLNFWSTWCGPCIKEFPKENEIHLRYSDKGLLILNICVESREDKWRDLTKQHDLKTINLFCSSNEYESVRRMFDLSGYPRSVLVGRDFVVRESHAARVSELTDAVIREWIRNE
ncbi:TlpA disulfide reductase family protein [Chryseolinea sp. T2]|uniref:TlpA family protein disulfide reductase n=1 Tax=Chryseolinea sp. T2 TaxID=3129255 RepID=UPI003076DA05